MDPEAYMNLAKKNEDNCGKEIAEILKKYSCEPIWHESYVNGELQSRGLFFKFNPAGLVAPKIGG